MKVRSSKFTSRILLLIGFFLFFFLFSQSQAGNHLRSLTLSFTQPVLGPIYSFASSVSSKFSSSGDITFLESENERLRDENLALKLQVSNLQTAQSENETLRQLIGFYEDDSNSSPKTLARIIARDPDNPSLIILNAGLREGVSLHNAVVVDEGIMVAKITEVYARSSKALLLTDSASSVAVTVSGGAPSSKIAHGERGLSLLLDQVPPGESLTEGQLVITSGLEAAIPKGLIVGEIEETISESNDLFQKAILRPLVDYSEMTLVTVILGDNSL